MSASRHRGRTISPPRARAVAAALAGAVALLASGTGLGSSSAAPLRSCTLGHGTIVAVDFAHWGGPIVRGCGVGRHSGYALLHAAGFTTAGDEHDGPAVICRLGDTAFHHGRQYPTANEQACVQTPPTTGYWAYWVAPRGTNHWAYSPLGAIGDVPKPGEVELWIFGATNVAGTHGTAVPAFSPTTLRARALTPAPVTTTTRTSTSSTTTLRTTSTHSTSTTTTTANAPTTTHSTTSSPTAHHPQRKRRRPHHGAVRHHRLHPLHTATMPRSTSTTRAGGTKIVSAKPTSRRASAGSSTPLVIGVAIALLLCAGAGRAIWLRRHEE